MCSQRLQNIFEGSIDVHDEMLCTAKRKRKLHDHFQGITLTKLSEFEQKPRLHKLWARTTPSHTEHLHPSTFNREVLRHSQSDNAKKTNKNRKKKLKSDSLFKVNKKTQSSQYKKIGHQLEWLKLKQLLFLTDSAMLYNLLFNPFSIPGSLKWCQVFLLLAGKTMVVSLFHSPTDYANRLLRTIDLL